MATKELRVEYNETYVAKGVELEVTAPTGASLRILDVTPVGDEMRYQYVVIWENGSA